MITSEGDNAGESLSCPRKSWLMGIGKWLAHENTVVAFLDLLNSPGIVVAIRENGLLTLGLFFAHMKLSETTHEVTGTSPQSKTFRSLTNGFASSGTL